jgi:hypothetical protein
MQDLTKFFERDASDPETVFLGLVEMGTTAVPG